MSLRFLALALTGAVLSAGAARAQLPAATYLAFGDVYTSDFTSPYWGGNFRLQTAGTVSRQDVSATMGVGPSPYVELHMSLIGDEYIGGERATLTYSFEVVGPEDILIPLKALVVASSVVDNTGNDAYGQYIISVSAPQGAGFGISNGGGSYGGTDSYNGSVDFSVMANQINTVTLFASGYVNGTSSGHVDIYADPVFSFAEPVDGYSLSFSNGVGNSVVTDSLAGVPEPASWALMIAGFGLAGAALRRRHAVAEA
jgi:hypothetical protein